MPRQSDPLAPDGQGTQPTLMPELVPSLAVAQTRDPFLNSEDASGYLGIPKATLLTWRVRRPGYGPRAVRAGGRLKYRVSELDRWLHAHEEPANPEQESEEPPAVRTRRRASRVNPMRVAPTPDGAA